MQLGSGSFILALTVQERKKKNQTQLVIYLGANAILSMNFNQGRGKQGELGD